MSCGESTAIDWNDGGLRRTIEIDNPGRVRRGCAGLWMGLAVQHEANEVVRSHPEWLAPRDGSDHEHLLRGCTRV